MSDHALTEAETGRVAEVFETHRRFIESVAAAQVNGDHTEAVEIVQAVAVRLCRRLGGFRGSADLRTWLYRVTVNAARDRRRSQVREARGVARYLARPVDPDGDIAEPHEAALVRDAAADESAARVRDAVAALPDDERRVIMARYGLGPHARGERTHRAVGVLLKIGTSTSSVIEQRAIARLRAQLSRQPE